MRFSAADHEHMSHALRLAWRGAASSHPNPRVGCVLVREGGVVGQGWHHKAGEAHAEISALQEAGDDAKGSTAYVTLEPCNHHGRTPPCSAALLKAGVTQVIVAMEDPNPLVSGSGIAALEAAGIPCKTGLLATQAEDLNRGFVHRMRLGRPWVRIKLAQSLDGRTALKNGVSQWISGPAARQDVQHWRARSSAVMTGIGTLLLDDPSLDVRIDGAERQPLRVIVDSHWRTPADSRTLALPGQVVIAGCDDKTPPPDLAASGAKLLGLPAVEGRVDLQALLVALGGMEINEIQVEAGAILCGALLELRLVDEILLYQAPCILGDTARGGFALGQLKSMEDRLDLEMKESLQLGKDLRLRLQPQYPGN